MNHEQKKKMKAVLLALPLLAAPAALQAQYNYTTNADGVSITITGYTGTGGAVAIPTNINGLTVSGIGQVAFYEQSSVTSVIIPGTVTSIGEEAFKYCSYMTNVTIPGSITNIGLEAFAMCASLTQVTIPATVTNLGPESFADDNLTNVTAPGSFSASSGFSYAFGGNPNLANITIDNGVTSIGNGMFAELDTLTNLTIPGSVTNIGEEAFENCYNLTNVTLSYGLSSIGENAFSGCTSLLSVTIPASVTNLASDALGYCGPLPSVFFAGNAPTALSPVFTGNGTVYYLTGTTGWSNTYAGYVTALWNPQMQVSGPGLGVQNNQFGFNITGTSKIPIVVEACTNLASPFWTPLKSLSLTNGLVYFSEPLQTNGTGRFYRISAP